MLRIGHLSTLYHTALLFISRQEELEEELRSPVQWRLYSTGPAIIDAFLRDEIDLAYIGLPPAIIGIEKGLAIKCIAGGHVEGTVIAGTEGFRGYPDITGLSEFFLQFKKQAVQKIGIPGKGSIHDVIIRETLRDCGIDYMEIVNYPSADLIVEAMKRSELSVAAGTPNLAIAIKEFIGGKILWPPERLWPFNPSYGIVVREELLKAGESIKRLLKEFLHQHEEACNLLRTMPAVVAEEISKVVGVVDKGFVLEVLRVSPRYCAALTEEYISSTLSMAGAMKRLGYIKKDFSRQDIFYEDLIREVHPSEGHY